MTRRVQWDYAKGKVPTGIASKINLKRMSFVQRQKFFCFFFLVVR